MKGASDAEKIAVGADSWNWLESACRRAAAAVQSIPSRREHAGSTGGGEP